MRKEDFEWIHSWCDYAGNNDLPRILLIGDSIVYGYQEQVRTLLRGKYYVDYLSSSYSLDNPFLFQMIKAFVNNSDYAYIHVNHGLHSKPLSKNRYKTKYAKIIAWLQTKSKVGVANTTTVNKEGNKKPHKKWMKKVIERNEAVEELAKELGFNIDDLYTISRDMPVEKRRGDGVHYESGSDDLAAVVAEFIKKDF